jgi:putative DNA primase/helicase
MGQRHRLACCDGFGHGIASAMSGVCFCGSYSVQSFSRIRSEMGTCCVACPRPAAVLHGLKIRKSKGPGWEALPLCPACVETVQHLGPVAELLTVALQLQEPALRAFCLSRGELPRGIGFFARFLFARPKSTQGTRTYSKAPQAWPALSAFERRLIALLESTKPLDDAGMLQLSILTLDEAEWTALYDRIELDLAEGKRYYDVRDVAAKAADNIARLAALFHLFEHGPVGRIAASTIEAAGLIVLWHLNEARRFFGDFARPAEFVAARELEEWLLRHTARHGQHPLPFSSIQQLVTPKHLRQRQTLEAALNALAELGRARPVADAKPKLIEIRPSLRDTEKAW